MLGRVYIKLMAAIDMAQNQAIVEAIFALILSSKAKLSNKL
jgi:hypothetical protein